jgi:hypothetical protein
MPSLYQATSFTKNALKWGGIGLGAFMILVLLYRGGKIVATSLFPKKPIPPKAAFGKLPAIIFPENVTDKSFTYSLDTVSGSLGNFPDRADVYKTIPPAPTLLDLQTTRAQVNRAGFNSSETLITDTQYSWRDAQQIDRLLTINTVSKDFTISSNYLNYPDLSPIGNVDPVGAIRATTDFLKELDLYPNDFDPNKTATQLLTLQGNTLFASTSLSTAQLVRVDLFQSDVNKFPIMYSHPPYSLMHFLVGGSNSGKILDASFAHQQISDESTSYPIITVDAAYSILKKGKAYIASYYGDSTDITIKDIYLAYFISDKKQDYLIPIYVFEGKEGFYAYVSAVTSDLIL